jgi:hypothetical protein
MLKMSQVGVFSQAGFPVKWGVPLGGEGKPRPHFLLL